MLNYIKNTTKILLPFFSLLIFNSISAQNNLDKGDAQINVGLGMSNWGLPVYVGADFGVVPDFTIGAEFSYRNYNDRFANIRYRHSVTGALINGNYHFNTLLSTPSKLDIYAGLNLGFYSWQYDRNYPGARYTGWGWGGQIGGRYFFSNKVGLNLEFGGGAALSGGKLGLTFKL